ncbi:MAG: hypothetical protein L0H64_11930 [Pseudonocardia sp.]|nr:hypothetical protein [Pseudonocardia sp.]
MNALSPAEKAELLDALLTARPELRGQAEELATRRLSKVDSTGVVDAVESALRSAEIDELDGRAGHRPGIGYLHPVDAAAEILDELLRPFLDDLQRHARLGMTAATTEVAVGILHGLHRCRDGGLGSLLEYSPDSADERAAQVVWQCRALAVDLPVDDLVDALPSWEPLFGHGWSTR